MQTAKIFSLGGTGSGSVGTGFLQVAGGVLDTTLRVVTDNAASPVSSPLQLSTTQVRIMGDVYGGGSGGGLVLGGRSSGTGGIWPASVTPDGSNHAFLCDGNYTYLRAATSILLGTSTYDFFLLNSTGISIGGGISPSARLHVRGDGSNPIAWFENGAGTPLFRTYEGYFQFGNANNLMQICDGDASTNVSGISLRWRSGITTQTGYGFHIIPDSPFTKTSAGAIGALNIGPSFAAATGSADFRPLNIGYAINNSGAQSGTATGIFLNATETALNGMTHNLMDLQVGGVSKFRITNNGNIAIGNTVTAAVAVASTNKVEINIDGTTYYLLATT